MGLGREGFSDHTISNKSSVMVLTFSELHLQLLQDCKFYCVSLWHISVHERLQIAIIPGFVVKVGSSYILELVSPLYKMQFMVSFVCCWAPEIHSCFADNTY